MTRLFVTLSTALAFALTSCTQPLPRECVYRTPDGTIVTGACP